MNLTIIKDGITYYNVVWAPPNMYENSWEPQCNLSGCDQIIAEYKSTLEDGSSSPQVNLDEDSFTREFENLELVKVMKGQKSLGLKVIFQFKNKTYSGFENQRKFSFTMIYTISHINHTPF